MKLRDYMYSVCASRIGVDLEFYVGFGSYINPAYGVDLEFYVGFGSYINPAYIAVCHACS